MVEANNNTESAHQNLQENDDETASIIESMKKLSIAINGRDTEATSQKFSSLAEAYRVTGIRGDRISLVCRGFRTYVGGYRWEYVDTTIHNKD
ncbi:1171_t:CDS:2 [Diversispora eburnea]|uniref:1171_t:CDS:1 n=1 Tax=Diversispora eburnea TaxID=1213867 RepID=A0A9N9G4N3_9GLOM|nr:1171_t:CDS:2 [Diversispora eburnea]